MTLSAIPNAALRVSAWGLLLAGGAAGVVLPHPVTTALWAASARLFAAAGDARMVSRLTSATKFGPQIRRRLTSPSRRTSLHLRPA